MEIRPNNDIHHACDCAARRIQNIAKVKKQITQKMQDDILDDVVYLFELFGWNGEEIADKVKKLYDQQMARIPNSIEEDTTLSSEVKNAYVQISSDLRLMESQYESAE